MSCTTARIWLFAIAASVLAPNAHAQQPNDRAIVHLGDAVVTGFSGTIPPDPNRRLPPGKSAADLTFIDPEGLSARVIDVARPNTLWDGRQFDAPKTFDVHAKDVGQVFGVALDDQSPPNIYLAATSVFGLNIVKRGRDGQPERMKTGGPGAGWMKGQFGLELQGGPGAIYRVDGRTGVVTLFANVTLDGVPNPTAGLGNLAYDAAHRQLFVSDLHSGMIHRFDLDGRELGRYDHGVTGRTAGKLAPLAYDPKSRPNIATARFDSQKPATWGYAPAPRQVWALTVHDGRLYYSVAAGPQIWSVGIARDGSFADDPRWEFDVPAQAGPLPVTDIAFSEQGALLLAQRALVAGSYDYSAFTQPGEPQVFRVWPKGPNDPPSPGRWKLEPEEYAVGFAGNYRNTNGGIALGYGYGREGTLATNACEFALWTTGQNLRNAPTLRKELEPGGPLVLDGLQASPASPVRDFNAPPWTSYFVRYGDKDDQPRALGHLGSVRIFAKPCPSATAYGGPGHNVSAPYTAPPPTVIVDTRCTGPNCPPPPPCVGQNCPTPPIDIGIAKIGEINTHNPDGDFNFTIGVRNMGGPITTATTLTFTDVVPPGMTFKTITGTNYSCLPLPPVSGGNTVTCTYTGTFPIAANQVLGSVAIVADGNNEVHTNCAVLGQSDSNSADDKACVDLRRDSGTFTVVKEVTNNTNGQVSTAGLTYPVTVTCGSSVTQLNLFDGLPQTVGLIPYGTTCQAQEGTPPTPAGTCSTGAPTWTITYDPANASAVVSNGTNSVVKVKNALNCPTGNGGDGYVLYKKEVISHVQGYPTPPLTFPVNVSCSNGTTATLNLASDGTAQSVGGLPIGTSCTVIEPTVASNACPQGMTTVWNAPTYSPSDTAVAANPGPTVTITNPFDCKTGDGGGNSLTVTKQVINRTDPQLSTAGTTFAISTSCVSGSNPAVVTAMPLQDGGSQTINGLALNSVCTVTETLPDPPQIGPVGCDNKVGWVPYWSQQLPAPVTITGPTNSAVVQNILDCKPADQTGSLMVKKVVIPAGSVIPSTANFPITVTCGSMVTNLSVSSDGTPQTVTGIPMPSTCFASEDTSNLPNVCPNGGTPTWFLPNIVPSSVPVSPGPISTITVTNRVRCTSGGDGGDNGYFRVVKRIDRGNVNLSLAEQTALTFPVTATCGSSTTPLNVGITSPGIVSNVPVGTLCTVSETLPPAPTTGCPAGQAPAWVDSPSYDRPSITIVAGQGPVINITNKLQCVAQIPPAPRCPPPQVPDLKGGCMCPDGKPLVDGQCVSPPPPPPPKCAPPMIPNPATGQCDCPHGMRREGKRCVKQVVCIPPAHLNKRGTACECSKGMIRKGNTCVEREQPRKRQQNDDVLRAIPGIIGNGVFRGGNGGGGGEHRGSGGAGGAGGAGGGGGGGKGRP